MATNYKTETFDNEHKHFGGLIYESDFNTNHRGKDNTNGSTIARRIESDMKWEQKLHINRQKENARKGECDTYGKS